MSQTFAEIVDEVKQLSFARKEELQELLHNHLIEERGREIRENAEKSLQENRDSKIKFFTNTDEMMDFI